MSTDMDSHLYSCTTLVLYLAALCRFTSSGTSSVAPSFVVEPQSAVVRSGDRATVRCAATAVGGADVTLTWTVDGVPTAERHDGVRVDVDGSLSIASFSRADEGSYRCVANSSVGVVVSRPARLVMPVLGPFEGSPVDQRLAVIEGNTISVQCPPVVSRPAAIFEFLLNGTRLERTDRHRFVRSGCLRVVHGGRRDTGTYRCVAVNPVTGDRLAAPASVDVTVTAATQDVTPRILHSSPPHVTVAAGQNLTLECTAEGWPVPAVRWHRYGGQLPRGRHSHAAGVLTIERVDSLDAGTYVCEAKNAAGLSDKRVIFVDVLGPPVIAATSGDQTVREGSTVKLQCSTEGSSAVSITWLQNGVQLSPSAATFISNFSIMLVSVKANQSGVYQCIANNSVGIAHAAVHLRVLKHSDAESVSARDVMPNIAPYEVTTPLLAGSPSSLRGNRSGRRKPKERLHLSDSKRPGTEVESVDSAPPSTHVTGTAVQQQPLADGIGAQTRLVPPSRPYATPISESSVLLRWSSLSRDGLHVVFYKVQYKRLGGSRREAGWQTVDADIPRTKHTFEVTGLRPGGTYRFRLVAVYSNNDNKHGPNSDRVRLRSTGRKSKTPGPGPLIVTLQPLLPSSLTIKWQYIPPETVPIDGFIIHYRHYDLENIEYSKMTISDPEAREALLSPLDEGTSYSVRMQSYNAYGHSEFGNTAVCETLGREELSNSTLDGPVHGVVPGGSSSEVIATPSVNVKKRDDKVDDTQRLFVQQENDTLYVILGVVVGAILIGVIVALFICVRQQKRQQLLLAALQTKNKQSNGFAYTDSWNASRSSTAPLTRPESNGAVTSVHRLPAPPGCVGPRTHASVPVNKVESRPPAGRRLSGVDNVSNRVSPRCSPRNLKPMPVHSSVSDDMNNAVSDAASKSSHEQFCLATDHPDHGQCHGSHDSVTSSSLRVPNGQPLLSRTCCENANDVDGCHCANDTRQTARKSADDGCGQRSDVKPSSSSSCHTRGSRKPTVPESSV